MPLRPIPGCIMAKRTESCGRCSVSTVVDATEAIDGMSGGERTGGEERAGGKNPFDGDRIELPEEDVRRASFVNVWLGRAKERLDGWAMAVAYGR